MVKLNYGSHAVMIRRWKLHAKLAKYAKVVIFGSLVGFTAYSWLLKNARPSLVATYAYVNPLIAVILGWMIAGESMTGQMLISAGVVVGSVVLITSQNTTEAETEVENIHESGVPAPRYST